MFAQKVKDKIHIAMSLFIMIEVTFTRRIAPGFFLEMRGIMTCMIR